MSRKKWPGKPVPAPKQKKEPKKYVPPKPKAQPNPAIKPAWQCMWGCGASFGHPGLLSSHESNCDKNPNNA